MKKIIFILIILLITGAIFLMKQNSDNKIKNATQKIDKQIVTQKPQDENANKPKVAKNKETMVEETKEIVKIEHIDKTEMVNTKPQEPSTEVDKQENNNDTIVLNKIKEIVPKLYDEVNKIPDCLEGATIKEEALSCIEHFTSMHKKFLKETEGYVAEDNGFLDDLIWDEKTKQTMIEETQIAIEDINRLKSCAQGAQTKQELEQCKDKDDTQN